ncbi:Hsp20/alpha crystallin family protein [Candidatus Calescamantes bacterium]|nr:Hsp20/alpha crystallin family protein [Candidatus Calescamantes bacterium]HDO70620.1 Hsp20/alpha crystallin family protein [bacterium]HEX67628.1 Hsp20/alpha crystallin family protein [bacterium]
MDLSEKLGEEIRRIQEEMERFFRDFSPLRSTLFAERGRWHPFTDIIRTRDGFLIRVEVAGLEDDDFEVVLEKGNLIIRGERRERMVEERVAYHQMEISYGPFEVIIPLEIDVDEERIKATYERGILEIYLPLRKAKKSTSTTRIKVK